MKKAKGPWADSETLARQKEKRLKSGRQRRHYRKRKSQNLCAVNGCKSPVEAELARCFDHSFGPDIVESVCGGGPGRPKTRALNRVRRANPQRLPDGPREHAEREAEFKRLKKQRRR